MDDSNTNTFLSLLRTIQGKNRDLAQIGAEYVQDEKSPSGERPKDNITKKLLSSFKFPSEKKVQYYTDKMQESSTYGNQDYEPEYVPFAYTNTSDPDESIKYGYIVRVRGANGRTIFGVTTPDRDYNQEGARNFFDKIKNGGGNIRLYGRTNGEAYESPRSLNEISNSLYLGDPKKEVTYSSFGEQYIKNGSTAFSPFYSAIKALRQANGK